MKTLPKKIAEEIKNNPEKDPVEIVMSFEQEWYGDILHAFEVGETKVCGSKTFKNPKEFVTTHYDCEEYF